ncbi:Unknown protein [Striga hermonthica]|uniref:Uncharacterized protein n=1 Tax=Striga hermonthica TaxID=68872 RepID=A0A9N7R7V7_STRHE|nr:Unknown protein [Striga hermonthica]
MAKSCKGLAMELVKCLSESDCVKVENRPYRECAKEKSPKISSECVGLRETYFNLAEPPVWRGMGGRHTWPPANTPPPPSSVSVQTRIDRNLDGGCRRVHKGSTDFAQIRESSRP